MNRHVNDNSECKDHNAFSWEKNAFSCLGMYYWKKKVSHKRIEQKSLTQADDRQFISENGIKVWELSPHLREHSTGKVPEHKFDGPKREHFKHEVLVLKESC